MVVKLNTRNSIWFYTRFYTLQYSFDETQPFAFQYSSDGLANFLGVWRMDARGIDHTIQHKLRSNPARHTDSQRHRRVTRRTSVLLERRRQRLLVPVSTSRFHSMNILTSVPSAHSTTNLC